MSYFHVKHGLSIEGLFIQHYGFSVMVGGPTQIKLKRNLQSFKVRPVGKYGGL